MSIQSLYKTYNRYRTLHTDKIYSLPIIILMPHSSCNCRCVMCDIWKGNNNLRQLSKADIASLANHFQKFATQQVLISGGEALLHPNFFEICEMLKKYQVRISLLTTGLTLKRHAREIVSWVDDVIVSLDGDAGLHDAIRNIPNAFSKLREGIAAVRNVSPGYPISGRTVIHRLNFRQWPDIIKAAKSIGLDKISFLPADVSSNAFNRELLWDENRQYEIALANADLTELQQIIDHIIATYKTGPDADFISESPGKLQMIYEHYAAFHNLNSYPIKKCNAPWVSAVVESDGAVRPCFFHKPYGNIKDDSFENIINSERAITFRKNLDIDKNETCKKCVCYLNLSPNKNFT